MSLKEKEKGILTWVNDELLPKLAKEGNLCEDGTSVRIKKFEYGNSPTKGVDFFTSNIYFLTVFVEDTNGKSHERNIIIKASSQHVGFRAVMETDSQFYNEVKMYSEVLPKFQEFLETKSLSSIITSICPKLIFAHYDDLQPEKGIIILENLRTVGFKPAESKAELDYPHCQLSMRTIAQFHAVSYAMKHKNPDEYQILANSWREVRYQDDDAKQEESNVFFKININNVIDLALARNKIPSAYLEQLRESIKNPYKVFQKLVEPQEPMSLICHGDFCRNNMVFQYDEQENPLDAKLIDFQTYRCASPAIDLSFFMYMNTTPELRSAHFDDLLKLYYKTFVDTVSEIFEKESSKPEIFSFEDFVQDYGDHACFGFMIAAFFLPMMMAPTGWMTADNFEEIFFLSKSSSNEEKFLPRPTSPEIDDRLVGILDDFYKYNFRCVFSE